jgi:ribosomal protein S18 acetylase RimI-like enzyme
MITYTNSLAGLTSADLKGGFFADWPNPPAPEAHFLILQNSYAVELARESEGRVVGFICAISDGISCAYIPHLEVLSAYRGQGIGTQLVRRMLARLSHLYMVDLICDPSLLTFYEKNGMRALTGMVLRNYDRQNCAPLAAN